MRRAVPLLAALLPTCVLTACAPAACPPAPLAGAVETICFTPGGDCTGAITARIDRARARILIQAYDFTSPPITAALVGARRRGLDVQVILDRGDVCWSDGAPKPDCRKADRAEADALVAAAIPVLIDAKHKIAHNKVMVIDADTVITGSFNFTVSAQKANAENLVVLIGADIASAFAANWRSHAAHSQPYPAR